MVAIGSAMLAPIAAVGYTDVAMGIDFLDLNFQVQKRLGVKCTVSDFESRFEAGNPAASDIPGRREFYHIVLRKYRALGMFTFVATPSLVKRRSSMQALQDCARPDSSAGLLSTCLRRADSAIRRIASIVTAEPSSRNRHGVSVRLGSGLKLEQIHPDSLLIEDPHDPITVGNAEGRGTRIR